MSLVLHYHPLSSYCWKVLIGLYELEIPFEARMLNFGDPEAVVAHKALWPTAKIPLLEDTETGEIVPETSIQLEWLDARARGGRLLPPDAGARLEARLWDRLFDLYVMNALQDIVGDRLRPEGANDPHGVEQARKMLQMAYGMIDKRLAGREWAVGEEFGLADCAAAPALFYAGIVEPWGEDRPNLTAYFERLLARPSVARAIDEAKPWFQYFPYRELMPARFL